MFPFSKNSTKVAKTGEEYAPSELPEAPFDNPTNSEMVDSNDERISTTDSPEIIPSVKDHNLDHPNIPEHEPTHHNPSVEEDDPEILNEKAEEPNKKSPKRASLLCRPSPKRKIIFKYC